MKLLLSILIFAQWASVFNHPPGSKECYQVKGDKGTYYCLWEVRDRSCDNVCSKYQSSECTGSLTHALVNSVISYDRDTQRPVLSSAPVADSCLCSYPKCSSSNTFFLSAE